MIDFLQIQFDRPFNLVPPHLSYQLIPGRRSLHFFSFFFSSPPVWELRLSIYETTSQPTTIAFIMSEYMPNRYDTLLPSEDCIESRHLEIPPTANLHLTDNTSMNEDYWSHEHPPDVGGQLSLQPCLARQSLTSPPSSLLRWASIDTSDESLMASEANGSSYCSAFSSGADPRQFAWTWPGIHDSSIAIDERAIPGPSSQSLEDYETPNMTNYIHEYNPSAFLLRADSTATQSQGEASSADDLVVDSALIPSLSPRAGNDFHIYEPVPSNLAARPSLLTTWNDGSLNLQELLANNNSVDNHNLGALSGIPHNWMNCEDVMPFERMVDNFKSHQTCSVSDNLACGESPLETGSLPDLCCSRQHTPASGPKDVTSGERPVTPIAQRINFASVNYSYNPNPSNDLPNLLSYSFSGSDNSTSRSTVKTPSSRSSSILTHAKSTEVNSNGRADKSRMPALESSGRSFGMVSTISIPSPPQLFSNPSISRSSHSGRSSVPNLSGILTPISGVYLTNHATDLTPGSSRPSSSHETKTSSSRAKNDRPKRKRMHICSICGKDFNRPSALLLHSTVHTGERSNFCNVCGRSFSNLSNLRRHQRQLHVLESQMPLPEIPGPASALHAYNFGSQTRF